MYTSICSPIQNDFQSLITLIRDERMTSPIVLYSPVYFILFTYTLDWTPFLAIRFCLTT